MDEVRRELLHEQLALVERLAHEPEVELLEVAQPAVDELAGAARRAGGEVALLDQRHGEAATGRVQGGATARHAAADHEDVELLAWPAARADARGAAAAPAGCGCRRRDRDESSGLPREHAVGRSCRRPARPAAGLGMYQLAGMYHDRCAILLSSRGGTRPDARRDARHQQQSATVDARAAPARAARHRRSDGPHHRRTEKHAGAVRDRGARRRRRARRPRRRRRRRPRRRADDAPRPLRVLRRRHHPGRGRQHRLVSPRGHRSTSRASASSSSSGPARWAALSQSRSR